MIGDWIFDNMGIVLVVMVVGLVGLTVIATKRENEARNDRFHQMISMAKTTQDSLNVMLTFEKLKSDQRTRSAIISAGAMAGARR